MLLEEQNEYELSKKNLLEVANGPPSSQVKPLPGAISQEIALPHESSPTNT
jgi:hypothetical protein